MVRQAQRLTVLLDSSPLITLCKYEVVGRALVNFFMDHAQIAIPPEVEQEVASPKVMTHDAAVARRLIKAGLIDVIAAPQTPLIHDFYDLEETDCTVIRLGLALPDRMTVLDDQRAFIIANHYGLRPYFLPDLLVLLVQQQGLSPQTAQSMIRSAQERYSPALIAHTVARLKEAEHADPNHS